MITFTSLHINRDRLPDQVANSIQEMILEGNLKPGDQLPSERELVEQLGVSRTVVREAFRLLQERGLVRIITGSGTYVTQADWEWFLNPLGFCYRVKKNSFLDLIEIRRFLELEIAALAAQRGTDSDVEALENEITTMEAAIPGIETDPAKLERFIQADLAFHNNLAQASGNMLFPVLLSSIVDLLHDFRRQASSMPGAPRQALLYHRELQECVRTHDPERARQVMRDHMAHAEQTVVELLHKEQETPPGLK